MEDRRRWREAAPPGADSSAHRESQGAQGTGREPSLADATTPLRAAAATAATPAGEQPSLSPRSETQTPPPQQFPRGQKLARTPAAAAEPFELFLLPAGSSAGPTPSPIRDRHQQRQQQRQQQPATAERGALRDITATASGAASNRAAAADAGKTPGAGSCKTPEVVAGPGLAATPGEAPATLPLRRYMVDSGKVVGVANTVARYHEGKRVTARTTPFNVRVQRELEIEQKLLVPSPPPSSKQEQEEQQQKEQQGQEEQQQEEQQLEEQEQLPQQEQQQLLLA
ncbi:hypothetical protein TSOC_008742 [Tetrabaena socialis]|uniref:Uncharacterized protein n=1 Tax=Tetrabaena socialis TaxID=47790 RepID=A0A2J7ZXM9_9CHLO|nr:hypothetical protein TSOC_008742 [Tetrabaena socialis]|eukprot:PNH05016.1 hypothetical protein TSOC_008742 [Tetrabaena socialis]